MVNVAGRSRGCKTCQRRRVKCDEAKPKCAKCTTAKISCEGYVERGFIQVDFSLQREGTKKIASKPKHHYPSRPKKVKGGQDSYDTGSASSQDPSEKPGADIASTDEVDFAVVKTTPPPSLPLSAFLDSICVCFTSENLLRGLPNPEFLFPSSGATTSALALSNMYFGVRHHDPKATNLARSRYTKSIRAINNVIGGNGLIDKATLEAVFTLGIFEFVAPNKAWGWVWHFMGLGAMFARLGPRKVDESRVLQNIFSISISVIAMAAMLLRRETVFMQPAWKRTLRAAEVVPGVIGGLFSAQVEFLIDSPRLMIIHDEAVAAAALGPTPILDRALGAFHEFNQRLEIWKLQWSVELSFSVWSTAPISDQPVSLLSGEPYWTTALTYSGLIEANQLTRYWALIIMITLMEVRLKQAKAACEGYVVDTAKETEVLQDAATNICRSVDFLLQDYQQGFGSFVILFPLRMALLFFGAEDPRGKWVTQVMLSISGERGSWQSATEMF